MENYFDNRREEMTHFLPSKVDYILEIGCSKGQFVKNLSNYSEYWGVEINPEVGGYAENLLDKVIIGNIDNVMSQLPNEYFDLVICNDVIEHMQYAEEFLENIKSKIKENGFIVGSIPNVRYIGNLFELLLKKDWKYKESGILDNTHLRFFTYKSLNRFFKNAGYRICLVKGINHLPQEKKSSKLYLNLLIKLIISLPFGMDVIYPQFGFRIQKI